MNTHKRLIILILIAGFTGLAKDACAVPVIKLYNDGIWKQYYSKSDVADSSIAKEIDQLYDKYKPGHQPTPQREQDFHGLYVKYGPKLLPYLAKIAGDKGVYLHWMSFAMGRPVSNYKTPFITDFIRLEFNDQPGLLSLKRIMFTPGLGSYVRVKLINAEVGLSADEIIKTLEADYHWYIGNTKLLAVISKLPESEQVAPIKYRLLKAFAFGMRKNSVTDIRELRDKDIADIQNYVHLLGATKSTEALDLVCTFLATLQYPHEENEFKLLPSYQEALGNLLKDTNTPGVIFQRIYPQSKSLIDRLGKEKLSYTGYYVYALSKKVKISISKDGHALRDEKGVSWDRHQVNLGNKAGPAFFGSADVFLPKKELSVGYPLIEANEISGKPLLSFDESKSPYLR